MTALSFALNLPKFMEVILTENNVTHNVDLSQTRRDANFIFYLAPNLLSRLDRYFIIRYCWKIR